MNIDMGTIITVLTIVAGVIGGKEAWGYYKRRLEIKAKILISGNKNESELRGEIQEILEDQINELKDSIKLLTSRIKHLEEEREFDKKRISKQAIEITRLTMELGNGSGHTSNIK